MIITKTTFLYQMTISSSGAGSRKGLIKESALKSRTEILETVMRTDHDEYNWNNYTQEYAHQYHEMVATAGNNGSDFLLKEWSVDNGSLNFRSKLHANWKEIYQAAYGLNPSSVFECGCGGMYHLLNLRTLMPDIRAGGCDLLGTQVEFGTKQFHVPLDILREIRILDFSMDGATRGLGTWDFVFSQAVVMHLSTDKALGFIKNMSLIAGKAIMFMEGRQKHDYPAMFKELGLLEMFDVSSPGRFNPEGLLLIRRGA